MHKPKLFSRDDERMTWADIVRDVVLALVAVSFFGIPAISYTVGDYTVRERTIMATNKATVLKVNYSVRHSDLLIEYTTNTGERVTTDLTNDCYRCRDRVRLGPDDPDSGSHPGDTLQIKYVPEDPIQAYRADFQPGYLSTILFGGAFLLAIAVAAGALVDKWRVKNRKVAADAVERRARQAQREAAEQRQTEITARHNAKHHGNAKRQPKSNRRRDI